MANLIRSARSGSDWTQHDLDSYNIEVVPVPPAQFFGVEPSTVHPNLRGFQDWHFGEDPSYLPESSKRLARYLQRSLEIDLNQESCVDNFVACLLDELRMAQDPIVIRSPNIQPFQVSGESRSAQTDVSLVWLWTVLMLVEDKTKDSQRKPEAQLVAEAIAGFQNNNQARVLAGFTPLEVMAFPCLTMVGMRPTFYKVTVTAALNEAVMQAQYPPQVTYVLKCVVPEIPQRKVGMEHLGYRSTALKYFTAFRDLAVTMWSVFLE